MGSQRGRVVAIITVVFLQFAIPLMALVVPEKPNRLGWQMYSGMGSEIVVSDQAGEPVDVPWGELLARSPRPELDWTRHLPERLCLHLGEPQVTVTVGSVSRTVRC